MDTANQNQVIILEEDFEILKPYANKTTDGEMSLANELGRATIVKRDQFPEDCVRINSKINLLDLETKNKMEFTLVMPQNADIAKRKISILTPMGAALIGFRKGAKVEWKLPAGMKKFEILNVENDFSE